MSCPALAIRLLPLTLALVSGACLALETEFSGSVRTIGESSRANSDGLLALSNSKTNAGQESLRGEFSLKGRAGPFRAEATLLQSENHHGLNKTESLFNELYWSGQAADWHFTVGKKIVSWDVGQGFRPLDVIQQENRRTLYGSTLEGVRVAMAEKYIGDEAWSIVLANPMKNCQASGQNEAAAALRYYLRQGSTDWHAVARWGLRTGNRGGLAFSSVIGDSLEIHASALYAQRLDRFMEDGNQYSLQTGAGGWQRRGRARGGGGAGRQTR